MKKKGLTLLYLILNIVIVLVLGALDPELKDIGQVFYQIRLPWILGGVSAMILYWFADGVILYYTTGVAFELKSLWKCIKVSMIGQYYNAVTPFASGGQPVQIYYMGKFGVPAGSASSILMVKFLVYQVVLSIYCIAAFIAKGASIYTRAPLVFWISVLGFIINAGSVVFLMALSTHKRFVNKLIFGLLDLAHKIRLIKDLEKTKAALMSHVDDFHGGFMIVRGNIKAILVMGVMTAVQFAGFFSITYFIYRSFGLEDEKLISIIFIQALLYLTVSFVPTPGSTGASEMGFMFYFQLFFPKDLIFMAMLLWRLITYYFGIIAGGIVIFLDSIRNLIAAPSVRNN